VNHDNKLSREEFTPFAAIQPPSEESGALRRTHTQNKPPPQKRGLPGSLLE
jgi:hypothetical protein